MALVLLYSSLLIGGMIVSQFFSLEALRPFLSTLTMIFLSYIMIEVGLEFTLNKKRLKSYGWDYIVAATAAAFPWVLCAGYFIAVFHTPRQEAFLVAGLPLQPPQGFCLQCLRRQGSRLDRPLERNAGMEAATNRSAPSNLYWSPKATLHSH